MVSIIIIMAKLIRKVFILDYATALALGFALSLLMLPVQISARLAACKGFLA